MKPRILAVNDYYVPGFRGGTIQSLANIVSRLGERYEFWILTKDRDVTLDAPYPGVTRDTWTTVGRARVYYASPGGLRFGRLRRLVREANPDLLFLLSPLSRVTIRLLTLRRSGLLTNRPVLISPEGEFDQGALAQKALKKKTFLRGATAVGLFSDLVWRATSGREADEIRRVVDADAAVVLAPCMPPLHDARATALKAKRSGDAEFIYLSRLTRKKNLLFALQRFAEVGCGAGLDVFGPIEDAGYWQECVDFARSRSPRLRLHHHGETQPQDVAAELDRRHFFLLPSLGENFGYAILEAFSRGRPALLSTHTPWRALQSHHAGWDIDLTDHESWRRVIRHCVDMDDQEYQRLVHGAATYSRQSIDAVAIEAATIEAFESTMARRSRSVPG